MTPRYKTILQIAWPLIIANSFWNLQLTIDRIYLGMLSTESLGAAMAVMGVFWVPMALLQQTASYVTTFVAQYLGAKEENQIGSCVWQALYVSVVGGVLFLFQNYFSAGFFRLVGHDSITQVLEVEYFNALAYSALPTALMAAVSGFYTGLGQTRMVLVINFVGLVLNAILDYFLIFGNGGAPALGIAGAGYATTLANFGAAFFGLMVLFQAKNELRFKIRSAFQLRLKMMFQFLKFGLPSGAQWALEGLAFTVFLIILGRMPNGQAALAGSSIAVTVMMLSVLPSLGVAQGVMTLVGQKLGENQPEEAARFTWAGVRVSLVYMMTMAFSFYVIPEFYLSWFKNDQNPELWAEVQRLTPLFLKIVGIFTLFDSVYLNISFALKGAGDTRFVSIVALLIPWPIMILPTFFVREWENAAVWAWAFAAVYSLTIASILAVRFQQGRWKSMSVIH